MKVSVWFLALTCLLPTWISAQQTPARLYAHPTVTDRHGVIAPWYRGQNGQCDFRVRIAAETLPPGISYEWTELTYQEIADRLRLPEGTVKSRINRGRTELARQIQRLREEQDAVPRTGVSG